MPLDPLLRDQLEAVKRRGLRPSGPASPSERRERARRAVDEAWSRLGQPVPEVATEDVVVPVSGFPDVRVRIHRPLRLPTEREARLPALVTFFGGAFRQGGIDEAPNRWMHATRALEAGIAVLAVDYALAPEHRAPTQVEQGLAVLDWIAEHGAAHDLDPQRVALGGQSSGGNLAACVAVGNLDRARHPIRLQVLEVPALDLTGGHAELGFLRELGIPRIAVRIDRRSVSRDYLTHRGQARDPRFSPLLRKDLRGLPPTLIMTSEYDPLRGDGVAYHARLRDAGVLSSAFVAVGQTHDSNGMVGALLAATTWQATVVGSLRTLHDPA